MSPVSTLRAALFSKPARWIAATVLGLVVLTAAVLYGGSAWRLARTYDAPATSLRLAEPASAERGDRLASVYACKDCHGSHGKIFFDVPMVGRLVAPDLARTALSYSDAELVTALRHGIKRDHTSAIVMPADSLSSLADTDVADIIAWLRSLKPEAQTETAETSFGPLARVGIITGGFPFSTEMTHDPSPPAARPTGSPLALGEYLVKTACNHCHRLDEEHIVRPGLTAPPIRAMSQSYDAAQFADLLHTGKALGGRKLELMSEVSRSSFSHLTVNEIAAIHAYLNTPAQQPSTEAK